AIDMDVDGSDNVFVYVGFTTGQLDLDPGPNVTLVNPGKTYAKYNSSGQFQWGFSIGNSTDMSDAYGGISCDDAGNLYIAGDLGTGTYDMDPGPGISNLVVPSSASGPFMARYRPDGSLHWAEVRAWANGFSYTRDIAALPNGSGCYVVQQLDNDNGGQIDVDPGSGTVLVNNDSQYLLRYDSSFAYVAHTTEGFGEQRLAVDADGNLYMMARSNVGGDLWALKYSVSGQSIGQVYQTALTSLGNLRMADIVADGQGGALGSYSNNCSPTSFYRFFKMNVSGLVDFNLSLYSGIDCTNPAAKGFDVRGGTFVVGSFNNSYTVDFDPGTGAMVLPTGNDKGAVALYNWCSSSPFDPFGIDVVSTAWCVGDTLTLAADAFGDASGYTWDAGAWSIAAQSGDMVQVIADNAGPVTVSLAAVNACGSSAPVTTQLTASNATADLPLDAIECFSFTGVLDPGPCAGCTYVWQPGGETTATLPVDITETTTFSVTATQGNCSVSDSTTITIENCTGIAAAGTDGVVVGPVPVVRGQEVVVSGIAPGSLLRLSTLDGRYVGASFIATGTRTLIPTTGLAAGGYLLHGADERPLRIVVVE
ncbi:MAG: hypothetical protein K1X58_16565, partial [Flavobacteriales bacterium]|nr:hypothetical protein [Flavobacteriales bacterium]